VFGQEPEQSWPIDELAGESGPSILLKDRAGVVIHRLNTSQVVMIDAVYKGMCAVAEACPRLLLIPGDQPNAMATPVGAGGTVMINLGMTQLLGYDASQWAAVLGHEVAHLKLDHVTERLKVSAPMELAEILLREATNNNVAILAGDVGRQLVETRFSREQEHESDYLGAIWALEAGFEVEGAVRAQTELLKRYGNRSSLPFLQSHPTSQERIKRLSELAERLTPDRKLPAGDRNPSD
jgi:predicted Zn-dependent protease